MSYFSSNQYLRPALSESLHRSASFLHGRPPYTLTHMLNSSYLSLPLSSGSFSMMSTMFVIELSTAPDFVTCSSVFQLFPSSSASSSTASTPAKSSSTLLFFSSISVSFVRPSEAANSIIFPYDFSLVTSSCRLPSSRFPNRWMRTRSNALSSCRLAGSVSWCE